MKSVVKALAKFGAIPIVAIVLGGMGLIALAAHADPLATIVLIFLVLCVATVAEDRRESRLIAKGAQTYDLTTAKQYPRVTKKAAAVRGNVASASATPRTAQRDET